jgi:hypothetical protein
LKDQLDAWLAALDDFRNWLIREAAQFEPFRWYFACLPVGSALLARHHFSSEITKDS